MSATPKLRQTPYARWLAVFCLFSALASHAQTALLLKNGDRVSGRIVSETTNNVVIATAWGEQTLPLSLIEKRVNLSINTTTNPPPAKVAPKSPVAAATNAPVATPKAPVVAVAKPQPAVQKPPATAPKPVEAKKPKFWNFDIQIGANLQVNQVRSETYTGVLRANYLGPFLQHKIAYNGSYGRSDGIVSRNRMDGSVRTEYDFAKDKRAFVFNSAGAGYDAIRKVDLTYDEGAGLGYKLLQTPKFSATADLGANYQWQYFSDNTEKDYLSLRIAETFGWCITPRLGVDEKLEFYPHMTDFGEYRARLEVNTTYKLNPAGNIYLNFSVIDVYDTTPARNVTPNDLQVRSTIGLKF